MRAIHLTIAVLLLLTACGDSGDVDFTGELDVTAVEFEFLPDAHLIGQGDTEVIFRNGGSVIHEWVVLSDAIDDEDGFSTDIALFRIEAQPGQTTRATLTIEPGTYQVVCVIEGHFNAGMEATLEVIDS